MSKNLRNFALACVLGLPIMSLLGCGGSSAPPSPGFDAMEQDRLQQEAIKKFGEPSESISKAKKLNPIKK